MSQTNWMIYGANGYSGALIAEEAKARGLSPILAGRREEKVKPQAEKLGMPYRAFSLDDAAAVAAGIKDVSLVLHCAGPFSATSKPMVDACIGQGAHYLDITGEMDIFEACAARDAEAKAAGVVLCPGVGFDVIPTDCVALSLKEALPDATHLVLAFASNSSMSAGTAKTSVEALKTGNKIRKDGKIIDVPLFKPLRDIPFNGGSRETVRIPWGDVSTAYHTTGIPNIETYTGIRPSMKSRFPMIRTLRPILALPPVQNFLKKKAGQSKGPSESQRIAYSTEVYGQVTNGSGQTKEARLTTANGYAVTVTGSLGVVDFLMNNKTDPGYRTPAGMLGSRFVESLPGSTSIDIS